MFQIKNVTLVHRKDLRTIIDDLSLTLNYGDRAVMIGEEGFMKSIPTTPPFAQAIWSIRPLGLPKWMFSASCPMIASSVVENRLSL